QCLVRALSSSVSAWFNVGPSSSRECTAMAVATRMPMMVERHTSVLSGRAGWAHHRPAAPSPRCFFVPGIRPHVRVRIAACRDDWEQAFHLVAGKYQERGYEMSESCAFRFTAHHALPDNVVLVAREQSRVIATLSLSMDNTLLGLPMENIYGREVRVLRRTGRRLCEVGSLADTDLSPREFIPVFTALIKLAWQHHVYHGGDTGFTAVNPGLRSSYWPGLGFEPRGGCRACPAVRNPPAEAFVLPISQLQRNAPDMYRKLFAEALPVETLVAPRMPA